MLFLEIDQFTTDLDVSMHVQGTRDCRLIFFPEPEEEIQCSKLPKCVPHIYSSSGVIGKCYDMAPSHAFADVQDNADKEQTLLGTAAMPSRRSRNETDHMHADKILERHDIEQDGFKGNVAAELVFWDTE